METKSKEGYVWLMRKVELENFPPKSGRKVAGNLDEVAWFCTTFSTIFPLSSLIIFLTTFSTRFPPTTYFLSTFPPHQTTKVTRQYFVIQKNFP